MTIYIIILLLCLLGIAFPNRQITNRYIYLIAILMLVIGACRDISVGSDTYGVYPYNFYYTNFNPKSWNAGTPFEPGFNLLIAWFKEYISKDYMSFISFIFVLTFIPTIYFILKYAKNKAVAILVFYTHGYFFSELNIMRQCLALGIALLCFYYFIIVKRRFLIYSILILCISTLLHKSVLILIIVPIFLIIQKKIKFNKRFWYICICGSYIIAFTFQNIFLKILPYLSSFIHERYAMYMASLDELNSGITPLFKSLLAILVVYFAKKPNNIFLQLFLLGTILNNFLLSFSPVASRVALNLLIFGCIAIANTYEENKEKSITFKNSIIIYSIFLISYFYFYKNSSEIIPYEFRFM